MALNHYKPSKIDIETFYKTHMAKLPEEFLKWNYYSRRRLIKMLINGWKGDPTRLFVEFTRHNPVLCTAALTDEGLVEVNGKVVGLGYVAKENKITDLIKVFEEHIKMSDEKFEEVKDDKEELEKLYEEHSIRGAKLLLQYIYLEEGEAEKVIDFEKLATVELAKRLPWSSKHTWKLVQRNKRACLVFYQPPAVSYEIRGTITIHINDTYHKFVTLVHDTYHYTPPYAREDRPVYILHVEEVYNNSPTRRGFGTRLV